jgi:hypothetical protein
MYMILHNGRDYQIVQVPEGAIPDRIIEENYPACTFKDCASTKAEAESKIERDRARHRPSSY